MAVTQPLWPSIEPRKRKDSAILDEREVELGARNICQVNNCDSHRDTTVQWQGFLLRDDHMQVSLFSQL